MKKNNLERRDKRFHESPLKKTVNNILAGILRLISLLPFRVLFVISDITCFLTKHVFHYREKVVMENLKYAFPEKTAKERKQIAARFYRHFTDLMVESVKLNSISPEKLNKHITFEGLDIMEEYYRQGKSFIVLAMHHNNWEWCSFIQAHIKHLVLMIYNPVRGNHAMEKFLLHARQRWGGQCIPVYQSARKALEFHHAKIPTILWLGADQTPAASSKFWALFLNREAPFFSGPEKIAAKTNQAVFFQHVVKTGRGKYVAKYFPLIENPQEVESHEILLAYIRKMEEIIRQEPEYYLWSHRRWKHQRPEGIPLMG
ncbi:KDO2-lipid IV(A) lauroyltransferase [Mariniphaga anaerophila]|uniref:KDO2-lipid IV(A) lauroyltransferase n=1 Tax=Mariniphaga anaerophila TaxID=1484053 RepID=A0A1M5FXI5_9BACT|nr:lysophospholipid acyltransferase family protein [Mariniphaga anaerophila]SHF95882.1 KDO2-lipid IV(A) lauroyltransferase [Mariniphaga anaerophila]